MFSHMEVIRGVYYYITFERPTSKQKRVVIMLRQPFSLVGGESGDEQTWRLLERLWTANHPQLTRCSVSADVFCPLAVAGRRRMSPKGESGAEGSSGAPVNFDRAANISGVLLASGCLEEAS